MTEDDKEIDCILDSIYNTTLQLREASHDLFNLTQLTDWSYELFIQTDPYAMNMFAYFPDPSQFRMKLKELEPVGKKEAASVSKYLFHDLKK